MYVVFDDERNSDYRAVYFSRSTNAGQTWNPNIRVAGGLSNFEASAASIALDNQGWIYIAWHSWEPGPDRNVYFIRSTNGGASFSDSISVNDTTRASQAMASISVDSSGQQVFIAWEDTRNLVDPPNYDIYFSRSTNGGATFLPGVRVDDMGNDSSWQQKPSIGCTRSGDTIYVAWHDRRNPTLDVYFSRSIDGGQSFEPNILVNDTAATTPSSQWNPSLWVSKSGNVYVVWQDQRSGLQIYCDKSVDGGISFNQDIIVSDSTAPASYPSVAVDDSERIYVAWCDARDFSTTGHDIYFSFSADSGNTFSSDVRANDLGGIIDAWDWNANVAVNDDGKVFVAWDTDRHDPAKVDLDIYCATGQYVGIQEYCNPKPAIIWRCCPNPFRQTTTLKFQVPRTKNQINSKSQITLKIYNSIGQLIKDFSLPTAYSSVSTVISWHGDNEQGLQVPAGVYFIELVSNSLRSSKKVVKME